ncbi:MAG: hypothetical protein AAGI53_07710 [Planctomycetota bacterium]
MDSRRVIRVKKYDIPSGYVVALGDEAHLCPVCATRLQDGPPPWDDGCPSFFYCATCNTEFGFDDDAEVAPTTTLDEAWRSLRERWLATTRSDGDRKRVAEMLDFIEVNKANAEAV